MSASSETGGELTVILPTLNEAENIVPMVNAISELFPASKILVVDDNSNDGTPEKAQAIQAESGRIRVIKRDPSDKGLTASIMDGILNTDTKYFVVMDADFQHPPERIGAMLASLQEGNQLVIGVREDKMSMMFYRQFASWGANAMASFYLWCKRQPGSADTMSGFFGGEAALCQNIIRENDKRFERQGFKALFDLLKFAPRDIKIDEVIFKFSTRRSGESKLNSRIVLSIMKQCGVVGRTMATLSVVFLLSTWGRMVTAMGLGLLSTVVAIMFLGEMTHNFYFNTVLALMGAIVFMVTANELAIKLIGIRDSISRGIMLIAIAFMGYILNLFMSFTLNEDLLGIAVIPSLLGLTVAFSFDVISAHIHRPARI
jgi:dolichol-phosphate mannosyltransferase